MFFFLNVKNLKVISFSFNLTKGVIVTDIYIDITFSHLADALIQSDLQEVQGHSPRGK